MKLFKKAKKGFTLVELVVVIAVIAILAAVSVGAYFGVTDSANRSKLEQEAKQAYTNIQLVSLVDSKDGFDLDIDGLSIDKLADFQREVAKAGGDYVFTDSYDAIDDEKPTIVLNTQAVSASNTSSVYKQFDYYIPTISGMHANCNILNGGKITIVKGDNPAFGDINNSETPDTPDQPEVPDVQPSLVLCDDFTITAGESGNISYTVIPETDTISWGIKSGSGLLINADGSFTSEANKYDQNTVVVVATSFNGATDEVAITILPDKTPSVELSMSSTTIVAGSAGSIVSNVAPLGDTLTWSVTNGSGLTINADGSYTTEDNKYDEATVEVTATSSRGASDSIEITITPDKTPSVELSMSSTTIEAGTSGSILATVAPTNDTLTWSVTNGSGLTINSDGSYTTEDNKYDEATVEVTATSSRGASDSIEITITPDKTPSVELSMSSTTIEAGTSGSILATVAPTNDTLTWSVTNGSGLTINSDGSYTTEDNKYDEATVEVTATSSRGASDSIEITITPDKTPSVTLGADYSVTAGETGTISATVLPSTDTLTWESDNENALRFEDDSVGYFTTNRDITSVEVVNVKVTSSRGAEDTIVITVNPVLPQELMAGITLSSDVINNGDKVIIVANGKAMSKLNDINMYDGSKQIPGTDVEIVGGNINFLSTDDIEVFNIVKSNNVYQFETTSLDSNSYLMVNGYEKDNQDKTIKLGNNSAGFELNYINDGNVVIKTLHADGYRGIGYDDNYFCAPTATESHAVQIFKVGHSATVELTSFGISFEDGTTGKSISAGSEAVKVMFNGVKNSVYAPDPVLSKENVTVTGDISSVSVEEIDGDIYVTPVSEGTANLTIKDANSTAVSNELVITVLKNNVEMRIKYVKATSVNDILNKQVLFVYSNNSTGKALADFGSNIYNVTDVQIEESVIFDKGGATVLNITSGYQNNTYSIKDGTKYLAVTGDANNIWQYDALDSKSSWTVSVTEGVFTFKNVNYNQRMLQYNTGSPRFAAYKGTQQNFNIYVATEYEYTPPVLSSIEIIKDSNENYYAGDEITVNVKGYAGAEEIDLTSNIKFEYDESVLSLTKVEQNLYKFKVREVTVDKIISIIAKVENNESIFDTIENIQIKAGAKPSTSVTVTKSSFSAISGTLDDVISFSCEKNSSTSDPVANSNQIRLYQNSNGNPGGSIKIQAKEGYKITSIVIKSAMKTKVNYVLKSGQTPAQNSGTDLNANTAFTITCDSGYVEIFCMGTTKDTRLYLSYLSVTYKNV